MQSTILLYNLVMVAVDAGALALVWLRPTARRWLAAMVAAAAVGLVTALLLRRSHFSLSNMAAWGLFVHGTVLLAGSVVLCWRKRRRLAIGCAAGVGLLALVAFDAFIVEPTWLEVTRLTVRSEKIKRPTKLVIVADIQFERFTNYEREALRLAMAEKPDIVLFVGDYVQVGPPYVDQARRQMNDCLRELKFAAPRGMYAVKGNVDQPNWDELFAGLGVKCAMHGNPTFADDDLQVTCLSLGTSFNSHAKVNNPRPEAFHIVMGHAPDFAIGDIDGDLLVAGHTHGGQVRVPFCGPIVTHAQVPHRLASGLNELPGGAKLLVSRGVGMERGHAPRMRFWCRPELIVLELAPPE